MPNAYINSLTLTNFRNLSRFEITSNAQNIVLHGPNGAGKTNVLEAVSFFAPGRGLRRVAASEAIPFGSSSPWGTHLGITEDEEEYELSTGLLSAHSTARTSNKNGVKIPQRELWDYLNIFWLTPAQDGLFLSSPSERRTFLDRMVYYTAPHYLDALKHYEKALKERNHLLKNQPYDAAWFSNITKVLTQYGMDVAKERVNFVTQFAKFNQQYPTPFLEGQPALQLIGHVEEKLMEVPDAVSAFEELLQHHRNEHNHAKTTLHGPHRSDFYLTHPRYGTAAKYCSTGEQKVLLCWLVIQFIRFLQTQTNKCTILLLDDIVSHLDVNHRSKLFNAVNSLHIQTWYTGTESDIFQGVGDNADYFSLDKRKTRHIE